MVTKAYELDRPPPPSPLMQWVDRRLVPATLNAAAPVEGVLYRLSDRARRDPIVALLGAVALGYLLQALRRPGHQAGHRWRG